MKKMTERGSAMLLVVLGMVVMAGMGTSAVSLVSTLESSRTSSMTKEQAFGLAQAGLEYAKERLNHGFSPVVTQQAFGTGTFTVAADPVAGIVTATGQVGTAQEMHTITTNFGKNCTELDVGTAHAAGPNLEGIKLDLDDADCNEESIITHWRVIWEPDLGEKIILLQVQGDQLVTLFDNPAGYPSGVIINATDYTLSQTSGLAPINKMRFDTALAVGKTYSITMYFADGSEVTSSFVDI